MEKKEEEKEDELDPRKEQYTETELSIGYGWEDLHRLVKVIEEENSDEPGYGHGV